MAALNGNKGMLAAFYRLSAVLSAVFTALIVSSMLLIFYHEHQEAAGLAKIRAVATFNKDQAFRTWVAKHGGVYVPITKDTPPNPYLSHIPERDIITPSGRHLTLMNPAYVMRETMEQYYTHDGVKGHITGLNPMNPGNAPDLWEQKALETLKGGEEEVMDVVKLRGKQVLRYMKPMVVQEECQKCHGGYRKGDIKGGVGIIVPMDPYIAYENRTKTFLGFSHLFVWLLGMTGIGLGFVKGKSGIIKSLQADDALRKSKKTLDEAERMAHLGSWEFDIERNELIWSDEMYRILGLEPQEFGATYEAFLDVVHPDDREYVNQAYRTSVQNGLSYDVVHRIIRRSDGEVGYVHEKCEHIRDKGGKVIRSIGMGHDITKQKQAEKELAERVMLAEFTAEIGNALTMPGDLRRVLRQCVESFVRQLNAAFARIWTFNEKENILELQASAGIYTDINGSFSRLSLGESKVGMIALERKAYLTNTVIGDPCVLDHDWVRREGLRSFAGHPLVIGDRLIGVVAMFSREPLTEATLKALSGIADETAIGIQQKQYEEKLLKLSAVVEQSPATIVITDTAGNIEFVNPKFAQLTGYLPEETLGRHTRMLKSGNTPPEVYESLWATITSGAVWHGEFESRKKNGELFWEAATISPIKNNEGTITHFVAIKDDITGRKKLEGQLRQSQKMEAVGLLAGGVAHDFNNMLMAIVGYGNVLRMKLEEDHPLSDHIDKLLAAADRAAGLTQSLLAFSRKQVMDSRPVNLNEIIRRVEKFVARIIGEDIEIRTSYRKDPLNIIADSGQIEQVLMNLAANARDAMPHGGSFSIVTDSIEIDRNYIDVHGFGEPGTFALILASDTGKGMDAATRQRVFEPFFTTKEVGKGTGLGLSVTYGIIKQHNGYINIYSEPDKGTTFRIYLPLAEATAVERNEPLPQLRPRGGSETILLAEDEADLRTLARQVLTEFGYRVIEAVDGEDAVSRYTEHKEEIQLLLLDIIMPKKNGKDAYDEIRKMGGEVRTIFLSGYPPDMIRKNGILGSEFDLVMKPISPQNLLKKIREVLDK